MGKIRFKIFVSVMVVMALFLAENHQTVMADSLEVAGFDFPPFSLVKSNDQISGILVDLATRVMNRTGLTYTLKGYSVKKLYQQLAKGKTDIFIGIKGIPQYHDIVQYSNLPVGEIELRFYTIGNKPLPSSPTDLVGKKIITIFGYGYGGLIKFINDPKYKITNSPAKSHYHAFRMLEKGDRGDYVLDYRRPSEMLPITKKIKNLNHQTFNKFSLFFIVSNKTKGAPGIMDKIEKAYDELKAEGKIDEIWSNMSF